jgi:hypothetical protein
MGNTLRFTEGLLDASPTSPFEGPQQALADSPNSGPSRRSRPAGRIDVIGGICGRVGNFLHPMRLTYCGPISTQL